MSSNNLNETKRIFDYFVITGLPQKLTAKNQNQDEFQPLSNDEHERVLFKNVDLEANHLQHDKIEPIVDIAVLNRTLNEGIPNGYQCLWESPAGHSANLCYDSMFKQSEMYLLIKRGHDRPPITDIGIFYEGNKERVMNDCTLIKKTIGNNSANLNTASFNADPVYITYRRDTQVACNSLAVIDICVINKSKGETAPHSFNQIQKNINRGLFAGSVFICYKKAWIPAPQIKYTPTILYRYPQNDHVDIPFPSEIASFSLPMGAVIESWPISLQNSTNSYLSNLKPIFSTFVLNVNSDDGSIMEKVYGSSITFYEQFDDRKFSKEQSLLLNYDKNDNLKVRSLHSNKSLIILSRHPLFETFRKFLLFIFDKYTKKVDIKSEEHVIPIERYLSHIIFDVPFPTHQKPHVLVNLTDNELDCLSVNLPNETILPQSGASFIDLINNLGVENSINVFLFVLLQRSVMIHSLRRQVLTSVVEAISCVIFPFVWRYTYIPMCPLSLCQLVEAPGSFILGMDTRFFDIFDPPQNVICVDLDTNTISWTSDRNNINLRIIPKRVYNMLKNRLTQIANELENLNNHKHSTFMSNNLNRNDVEAKIKKAERNIELAIRETFLKSMAYILHNYKTFLRTVTRRPDTKAIDRNLSKFFDVDGFLRSKDSSCQFFYKELVKTQLFYDCIMNLSFASELEPNLADAFAFFAEICTKINPQLNKDDDSHLLDLNHSTNNQTIVILPPCLDSEFLNQFNPDLLVTNIKDIINNGSAFLYDNEPNTFPKLKSEIYLNTNSNTNSSVDLNMSNHSPRLNSKLNRDSRTNSLQNTDSNKAETQSISSANAQNLGRRQLKITNTPIGVRTKAEKLQAIKNLESKFNIKPSNNAKQNEKNKFLLAKMHAFCFLSNAYSLWFIYLPEYIKDCGELKKNGLNYAYQVLNQMQKHYLTQPDEICYRIMMQLCLLYKFPTLAVKTLIHMRKYKIEITPITYSFYNKALIETSSWPTFDQDRWAKIRLTWLVIGKFRQNLKLKKEREQKLLKTKKSSKKSKKKKDNSKSKPYKQASSTNQTSKLIQKNFSSSNSKLVESSSINSSISGLNIETLRLNDENKASSSSFYQQKTVLKQNSTVNDKPIIKEEKHPSLEKFERFQFNITLSSNQADLITSTAGILVLSLKLINTETQKFRQKKRILTLFNKKYRSEPANLNDLKPLIKIQFLNSIQMKNENKLIKKSSSATPITNNDPLGAFSTPETKLNQNKFNSANEDNFNDVKKRLFDYKPFSKTDANKSDQSDFLLENNKKSILNNHKPNNNNNNNDYISEDSDLYSDDDAYDDSDEDEEDDDDDDENENSDDFDEEEENESDVEVDNSHFLSRKPSHASEADSNDIKSNDKLSINKSRQDLNGSIDIENILVSTSITQKEKLNGSNDKKQGLFSSASITSPMTSFFSNSKVNNLFKKVGSSIETSGSKLKGMRQYLNDKTSEIKDVILSNTNQQDLTSKLKSLSNYHLKTPQYLNGFVKSTSSFSVQLSNSQSNFININADKNKKSNSIASQSSQDDLLNSSKSVAKTLDLENLPNDDSFKPLSLEWWGIDKSMNGSIVSDSNDCLVDIEISSCNHCDSCKTFIYDEEIMSGWTLNDSDLNIKCLNCQSSMVPNLYIKIQDFESILKYVNNDENNLPKNNDSESRKESHPFDFEVNNINNQEKGDSNNSSKLKKLNTSELTVQYLSPIVVRKELENIIINNGSQEISEYSFINSGFMNKHAIIFWNLIWYFKRIGVDSGHLATVLVNNRINILKQNLSKDSSISHNEKINDEKFVNFIPHQLNTIYSNHPNITIKCMWDNLKLHNEIEYHDIPLYLTWLNTYYNDLMTSIMNNRLVTVLSKEELENLRKSTVNQRTLNKLYELIIRNIKGSDVLVPLKNLLRERLRTKINTSIYREILYLIITALDRDKIDNDAFDTEYREAYKSLISNEQFSLIKLSDRPPNNVAVWSRRLFSPLLV